MQALGGLLDHLKTTSRIEAGGSSRGNAAALSISTLREFSLEQTLAMDSMTALALGVVPNPQDTAFMSLLCHLDRTHTAMGARVLRQWVLRPSTDIGLIDMRLDAVAELKHAHRTRASDVSRLKQELKSGLADTTKLLRRVGAAKAVPTTWLKLHGAINSMRMVSQAEMQHAAPATCQTIVAL